jgi:hypothetical protein
MNTPSSRIVKVLGKNHTKTIVFKETFKFPPSQEDKEQEDCPEEFELRAIYTYRGEVFYIDQGFDSDFDRVPNEIQEKVAELVELGQWVVDETIQ